PTIGVFTNIGTAHDEGFSGRKEKIQEKLKLFNGVKILFYHKNYPEIEQTIAENYPGLKTFSISRSKEKEANLMVSEVEKSQGKTRLQVVFNNQIHIYHIPFSDDAGIENLLTCLAILLYLGIESEEIQSRINALQKVAMRLEIKEG